MGPRMAWLMEIARIDVACVEQAYHFSLDRMANFRRVVYEYFLKLC